MHAEIKELPSMRVAYVRSVGKYGPENVGPIFCKLMGWAASHNMITPQSLVIGAYWDCPETTPPEQCRADACITVPADFKGDKSNGIEVQTLPGGKYAMYLANVFNDNFCTPWGDLSKWVAECGLQFDRRPCMELYYNVAENHPLKKWVVDFCTAVK